MTIRDRLDLYPPIFPYREHRLEVGGGHTLYVEECGNPNGQPVLIVHGGPGGGSNPTMRRFHNPDRYKIVLFDQRGCGQSTPNASIENNTTQDLVEDIERIRQEFGIDRWQLFGGSWGSTLALAYAETYPERVSALILRGIFLSTKAELRWFYQDGCSWIFPEAFAEFQRRIPHDERHDMIAAYHRRLNSDDPATVMAAARAWSIWEGTTLSLVPEPDRVARFSADAYAVAFARIESHYFVNGGFFRRDGELLFNAERLKGIPGIIAHGRYDVVTPIKSAVLLHQAWADSELRVATDAGHAMTEPGLVHELIRATRQFSSGY
ncbi:Proline iminopeptidase [Hyphomicrobium sp. GJ21]|uniref:prolyl aminopeptidase n=1 Tax=Hyphomicrobium sp. GJ21 TaxID=113574 RepID=UPI000622BB49|nr:prolyl aminopeptidase [Hyphomicrobium sp. GJ21]CEJ86918.1 Proline iminopeptidase [Hyphomicrobium sp. GJ21]